MLAHLDAVHSSTGSGSRPSPSRIYTDDSNALLMTGGQDRVEESRRTAPVVYDRDDPRLPDPK